MTKFNIVVLTILAGVCVCIGMGGCGGGDGNGYTNQWLHPEDVSSVYVEMFDSRSFRRGHEYVLTDAICKQIEAQSPYKIVSDRNIADTLLSGHIDYIEPAVVAGERHTGRPLELETTVGVIVTWKNLKTGELLIDNEAVSASASYSTQLGQDFDYAANLAVNRAAERIVESMEKNGRLRPMIRFCYLRCSNLQLIGEQTIMQ